MADIRQENPTPWVDGYYRIGSISSWVYLVEGESVTMQGLAGEPSVKSDDPTMKGTWKYGEFGDTHPAVEEETGKKCNNVEMKLWADKWVEKGVLSDDGKKLSFFGMENKVDTCEWLSEQELATLKDSGDPVDAPPGPYKLQPETLGKILWISGAPGLGKSTSGHLLSKTAGYVYYEADAFMSHVNPYIPPEAEEPSMATMKQRFLKGVPQERIDAVADGMKDIMAMYSCEEFDQNKVECFYSAMCKDIAKERMRMGGEWAVAQAVPSKALRGYIREQLGPDLIFIVLSMTKEDQLERVKARHGDNNFFVDFLAKTYSLFEPATRDEENSINLTVTNDMSRQDVIEKILEAVKQY